MGFKNSNKDEVVSDINVTPLVDVMLVLLVIFMVTAPMMFNGVNLNLPKTNKNKNVSISKDLVILSINEKREFYIDKNQVPEEILIRSIKKLLGSSEDKTVFLRADQNLKYGFVAKVMSLLKSEGINKISLITEMEE